MLRPRIVKIIKSDNPGYWYAAFIGQTFNVEPDSFLDDDRIQKYTVIPSPGTDPLYLINVDDCKPI